MIGFPYLIDRFRQKSVLAKPNLMQVIIGLVTVCYTL